MKYEYDILLVECGEHPRENAISELNDKGRMGWEAVGFTP